MGLNDLVKLRGRSLIKIINKAVVIIHECTFGEQYGLLARASKTAAGC